MWQSLCDRTQTAMRWARLWGGYTVFCSTAYHTVKKKRQFVKSGQPTVVVCSLINTQKAREKRLWYLCAIARTIKDNQNSQTAVSYLNIPKAQHRFHIITPTTSAMCHVTTNATCQPITTADCQPTTSTLCYLQWRCVGCHVSTDTWRLPHIFGTCTVRASHAPCHVPVRPS